MNEIDTYLKDYFNEDKECVEYLKKYLPGGDYEYLYNRVDNLALDIKAFVKTRAEWLSYYDNVLQINLLRMFADMYDFRPLARELLGVKP